MKKKLKLLEKEIQELQSRVFALENKPLYKRGDKVKVHKSFYYNCMTFAYGNQHYTGEIIHHDGNDELEHFYWVYVDVTGLQEVARIGDRYLSKG